MSKITDNQNKEEYLNYLKAFSYLYDEAKKYYFLRLGITIIIGIVFPIIIVCYPNLKILIWSLTLIWIIINHFIKSYEVRYTRDAAIIQEKFDTQLFNIKWNEILIEKDIDKFFITESAKNYKGDEQRIKDWYEDTEDIPNPINILILQQTNIYWDRNLKIIFAKFSIISTIFLLLIESIIAIFKTFSHFEYLQIFLGPSLPVILQGFELSYEYFKLSDKQQEIREKINFIWKSTINNTSKLSEDKCREIQDEIFKYRATNKLIPHIFYKFFRDKYHITIKDTVKTFIKEVRDADIIKLY